MRRLKDDLRLTQVVIEVVDARVPMSGRNPALAAMASRKTRLLVLEREDLADPNATAAWLAHFERSGQLAVAADGKSRRGMVRLRETLAGLATRRTVRAIVVGIPNAGKSTVINALAQRNVARAEDRAGVTRAAQWFRIEAALEVLDTAGILVPKVDSDEAQWKLAMCSAFPRARFDAEDVVGRFHAWAEAIGKKVPDLATFAAERGFVRRGNIPDTHNAAWSYIKEWSDGRFGRMTLELAPS